MSVDPLTKALAEAAVARAASVLDLGSVSIEWFTQSDLPARSRTPGTNVMGYARESKPGVIHLRMDVEPGDAIEFAAHECRHLWQYKHRHFCPTPDTGSAKASRENDAYWYGKQFDASHGASLRSEARKRVADIAKSQTTREETKMDELLAEQLLVGLREIRQSLEEANKKMTPEEEAQELIRTITEMRADYERRLRASGRKAADGFRELAPGLKVVVPV